MESKKMKNQELMTLGSTLVVLGIIFSEDQLLGYSYIVVGILLSVISAIKTKREAKRVKSLHF